MLILLIHSNLYAALRCLTLPALFMLSLFRMKQAVTSSVTSVTSSVTSVTSSVPKTPSFPKSKIFDLYERCDRCFFFSISVATRKCPNCGFDCHGKLNFIKADIRPHADITRMKSSLPD